MVGGISTLLTPSQPSWAGHSLQSHPKDTDEVDPGDIWVL